MNSGRSPEGIGLRHPAYESPILGGDGRSPLALPPTLPGPVQPEALPVPSNDGVGLHQGQVLGPIVPRPGQEHPEDPIGLLQAGTLDRALEDHKLLSQREILEGQLPVGSQDGQQGSEQR